MTRLTDTARYAFREMIRPINLVGYATTGVGEFVAHSAGLPLAVKVGLAIPALCGVANAVYRGYREAKFIHSTAGLIAESGGRIVGAPSL